MSERLDFDRLGRILLDMADRLVPGWLPDGRREGHEWAARNPTRHDKTIGSFRINLNTGVWADFSTGDKGGDLIALYAYIERLEQGEAYRKLAERHGDRVPGEAQAESRGKRARTDWRAILPVPADAPAPHVAHVKRGRPEARWAYRSLQGELLGWVYRFRTSDGGKETLPHVYAEHASTGLREWRWLSFPEPRPLYNLPALTEKPDAAVLLVEGEKCVDAAAEKLGAYAVVSWPGGGKAIDKADWSPLAGRDVILWPDADSQREKVPKDDPRRPEDMPYLPPDEQPGLQAMLRIAPKLKALGCRVWRIPVPPPGTLPDGWDCADAIAQGYSVDDLRRTIQEAVQDESEGAIPQAPASAAPNTDPVPAQACSRGMEPDAPDRTWERDFIRTGSGGIQALLANAYLVLKHHPAWQGVLAYDEFSRRIVKLKPPPYVPSSRAPWTVSAWDDGDASKTLVWLQTTYCIPLKQSSTADEAARMVAWDNRFHAVRCWLESLPKWDGTPRLPTMLHNVFGAPENEFTSHVGIGWLVTAVARVLRPGSKVDTMVVLEGGQGIGKSTAVKELCGEAWYLDMSEPPSSKDFLQLIQGNWMVEIGEMQSFSRGDLNLVKQTITRINDKFRAPYDRHPTEHPRQCIFVGTTNADTYLADPTGGRRFLPVMCTKADVGYVRKWRDQLWAEALAMYWDGFCWWRYPEDIARQEQEARYVADSWEEVVEDFLEGRAPAEHYPDEIRGPITEVTTTQLLRWALRVEIAKHTRQDQLRVANIMRRFGWEKGPQRREGAERIRPYRRPGLSQPPPVSQRSVTT